MRLGFLLFVALLGGCAALDVPEQLPVVGQLEGSTETFKGTVSDTDLTVTTSTGVTCTGSYVFVEFRQGRGTFKCSDGRVGPFQFFSTGTRGTGQGILDGKMFIFNFGDATSSPS